MKTTIKMTVIDWLALALVVIGALNWGLVGLGHFVTSANWNLVNVLFGSMPTVEFGLYFIVGIASLWTIYLGYRMYSVGRETPVAEPEAKAPRA